MDMVYDPGIGAAIIEAIVASGLILGACAFAWLTLKDDGTSGR